MSHNVDPKALQAVRDAQRALRIAAMMPDSFGHQIGEIARLCSEKPRYLYALSSVANADAPEVLPTTRMLAAYLISQNADPLRPTYRKATTAFKRNALAAMASDEFVFDTYGLFFMVVEEASIKVLDEKPLSPFEEHVVELYPDVLSMYIKSKPDEALDNARRVLITEHFPSLTRRLARFIVDQADMVLGYADDWQSAKRVAGNVEDAISYLEPSGEDAVTVERQMADAWERAMTKWYELDYGGASLDLLNSMSSQRNPPYLKERAKALFLTWEESAAQRPEEKEWFVMARGRAGGLLEPRSGA